MNFLESVRAAIINAKDFKLSPAQHNICEIQLTEQFAVLGAPEGIYDRWDVIIQAPNSIVTVRFWREGNVAAVLQLDSVGQWKGRDRASQGFVQLVSTGERDVWLLLANPSKWQRAQVPDDGRPVVEDPDHYGPAPTAVDWTPFEYNLAESLDKDALLQNNTAVCLIAFDRPAYFERVVKSLAANEIIHKMPVFLFLDQRDEKEQTEEDIIKGVEPAYWTEQVKLVREYLPQTVIIRRPRNFGCGRNIIDARIQMFTNMKYDRVFVFEDDMVVSPDYMQMCVNMLDWAEDNYSNVGVVQAWTKTHLGKDAKDLIHGENHVTYTNWWGYLQTKESWDAMEPDMQTYMDTFLLGSYRLRQHRAISAHFRKTRERNDAPVRGTNRYVIDELSKVTADKYHKAPPTGQDAATMTFLETAGYVRLAMSVNRGLYIGVQGIHMTPAMFDMHGMHLVELYELAGDKDRTDFWRRGDKIVDETDETDEETLSPVENFRDMEYIDNV